ncbi:hypothetical protein ACGFOU_17975 [Streptomyces sp. NPDC048595]|uniref:hypothetical protein n=1 Tax=Streptomyces sp. NPDC048595 TaxID=3365576 RepID=UPI00370F9F27
MDAQALARQSLAAIRLVNGLAALLAPQVVARRLGADATRPGLVYALRMFGVRTVVLGADLLLVKDQEQLHRKLRVGTLIHASDALAAASAGRNGTLPRRTATAATAISTVNVALTLLAQPWSGCPPAAR